MMCHVQDEELDALEWVNDLTREAVLERLGAMHGFKPWVTDPFMMRLISAVSISMTASRSQQQPRDAKTNPHLIDR